MAVYSILYLKDANPFLGFCQSGISHVDLLARLNVDSPVIEDVRRDERIAYLNRDDVKFQAATDRH